MFHLIYFQRHLLCSCLKRPESMFLSRYKNKFHFFPTLGRWPKWEWHSKKLKMDSRVREEREGCGWRNSGDKRQREKRCVLLLFYVSLLLLLPNTSSTSHRFFLLPYSASQAVNASFLLHTTLCFYSQRLFNILKYLFCDSGPTSRCSQLYLWCWIGRLAQVKAAVNTAALCLRWPVI